jgi:hypothetical protein
MKRLWNALILTAAFILFPVSCSFFGAVGTLVYSELDARDMAKGEEPHASLFFVVTKATVDGEEYYDFHSLNRLESFNSSYQIYTFSYAFNESQADDSDPSNCSKTFEASVSGNANYQAIDISDSQPHVEYTFLLSDQKGEYARDWTRYRYKVENISDEQQLVEVKFSDDDYQSTSRYIAEAHAITPVYSKILDPGYMFISFPVAFVLSTLLMFVIRHFRRKWFPKKD